SSLLHRSSLFVSSSRAHRDLHSSPTRRSSDLAFADRRVQPQYEPAPGVRVAGHPRNRSTIAARHIGMGPTAQTSGFGSSLQDILDRKSTRLNSSHVKISYAVFCLKKKTQKSKE